MEVGHSGNVALEITGCADYADVIVGIHIERCGCAAVSDAEASGAANGFHIVLLSDPESSGRQRNQAQRYEAAKASECGQRRHL
jgi:hypothetical protein